MYDLRIKEIHHNDIKMPYQIRRQIDKFFQWTQVLNQFKLNQENIDYYLRLKMHNKFALNLKNIGLVAIRKKLRKRKFYYQMLLVDLAVR